MKKEKLKSKRGITLIALIITVIIMLILVGATVGTIADGGGLFERAKSAVEQTESQTTHETIIGAMVLKPDGKIDIAATGNIAIPELQKQGKTATFTQTTDDFATINVTGNNGQSETYSITEREIVKATNPWVLRGLSPNWTFGKWYVQADKTDTEEGWFFLAEDGSYKQGKYASGEIEVELTSEQVDQMLNENGLMQINGIDLIAVGQWKCRLNSDGTMVRNLYGDGTYNGQQTLYVVEQ